MLSLIVNSFGLNMAFALSVCLHPVLPVLFSLVKVFYSVSDCFLVYLLPLSFEFFSIFLLRPSKKINKFSGPPSSFLDIFQISFYFANF